MSHLLYNRVNLTADTTYFMQIVCLRVKNHQENKLGGVSRHVMLNISALASHSESLPLSFSSAAVQLEMAPSLTKMKVRLFGMWHLTPGDLSPQYSQLSSHVKKIILGLTKSRVY